MNRCVFTGRVVRDAKYREIRGEDAKATLAFTLAINNGYGQNANTVFLDCITTGKLAESYMDRLYKGVKIMVEGYLYSYTYTNKAGEKRVEISLYVRECEIVSHTKAYLEQNKSGKKQYDNKPVINDTEEDEKFNGWTKSLGSIKTDKDGFMLIDDDCDLPFY